MPLAAQKIGLQRCMNTCKSLCIVNLPLPLPVIATEFFDFLPADEWISTNSSLTRETKKKSHLRCWRVPGKSWKAHLLFTKQHMSITLDATPGFEKVAVVSRCIKCNPPSYQSWCSPALWLSARTEWYEERSLPWIFASDMPLWF